MKLLPHHHNIFRAMSPGREYTANDLLLRADLPRGFNVLDVSKALYALRRIGAVQGEKPRSHDMPMIYRRVER